MGADSHDRSAAHCRRPPPCTLLFVVTPTTTSNCFISKQRTSGMVHHRGVARAADPPLPHLLFHVASPFPRATCTNTPSRSRSRVDDILALPNSNRLAESLAFLRRILVNVVPCPVLVVTGAKAYELVTQFLYRVKIASSVARDAFAGLDSSKLQPDMVEVPQLRPWASLGPELFTELVGTTRVVEIAPSIWRLVVVQIHPDAQHLAPLRQHLAVLTELLVRIVDQAVAEGDFGMLDEASAVRLRMECERRSVASGLADRLRRQRALVADAMLTNKSFAGVRAPTTAEQRERVSRTFKEAIDRARQQQMDFLIRMYERAKDRGEDLGGAPDSADGGGLGSGLDEVEEAGVVRRQNDPDEAARQSAKKSEAIRKRRATAPLTDGFIYPKSTRPAAHSRRANSRAMQKKASHASRQKKFSTFLDQVHAGDKDTEIITAHRKNFLSIGMHKGVPLRFPVSVLLDKDRFPPKPACASFDFRRRGTVNNKAWTARFRLFANAADRSQGYPITQELLCERCAGPDTRRDFVPQRGRPRRQYQFTSAARNSGDFLWEVLHEAFGDEDDGWVSDRGGETDDEDEDDVDNDDVIIVVSEEGDEDEDDDGVRGELADPAGDVEEDVVDDGESYDIVEEDFDNFFARLTCSEAAPEAPVADAFSLSPSPPPHPVSNLPFSATGVSPPSSRPDVGAIEASDDAELDSVENFPVAGAVVTSTLGPEFGPVPPPRVGPAPSSDEDWAAALRNRDPSIREGKRKADAPTPDGDEFEASWSDDYVADENLPAVLARLQHEPSFMDYVSDEDLPAVLAWIRGADHTPRTLLFRADASTSNLHAVSPVASTSALVAPPHIERGATPRSVPAGEVVDDEVVDDEDDDRVEAWWQDPVAAAELFGILDKAIGSADATPLPPPTPSPSSQKRPARLSSSEASSLTASPPRSPLSVPSPKHNARPRPNPRSRAAHGTGARAAPRRSAALTPLRGPTCEVIVLESSEESEDDDREIFVVGPTLARPAGTSVAVGAARPAASTARALTSPLTRGAPRRPPPRPRVLVPDSDEDLEIFVVGPTLAGPACTSVAVGAARPAASTARASTSPLTRGVPRRPPPRPRVLVPDSDGGETDESIRNYSDVDKRGGSEEEDEIEGFSDESGGTGSRVQGPQTAPHAAMKGVGVGKEGPCYCRGYFDCCRVIRFSR
ncbi:BZ3500_MvSof-1268-A1-R1_Chr10-3g03087 [Microbotryum saponariae]|uniref:BZ3500_MvSof-1268-A1-R1_Chr10-3g03087 protein n=1 Tax=Microbotryum saponariae TaxID=289078 RepID=A0A2X0KZV3_9BASI|nr:BZ3501_MvSof-1269-A2-R1_Chr10-2g02665 [Microbotryum saponariae]SDA02123.1 BZ3500_MvSof-1268-A1-R1_Chr10-3g03087 [Microbotryum saponariae]